MKILFILLLLVSNVYADTIDLDRIVVNASRSQSTTSQINAPITIVTKEQINDNPGKSLPEILGTVTGVHAVQYGNIKNAQVDLGGFGETSSSNVLVLIDGRRTNQIDLSGQDWAQIDPTTVDRIEVIRSPGSVLYGDNAVGGVINIVTHRGKISKRPRVTVSTEYGSYQTHQHAVSVSGATEKLDYAINASRNDTTGYRVNSNYRGNDYGARVGVNPNDTVGVDIGYGYHQDDYELPGALFSNNIAQFGRKGVRSGNKDDHGWTYDHFVDVTPKVKFSLGTNEGEFSLLSSARQRNNKFFTGTTIYETMYLTDTYEFQPKVILSGEVTDSISHKTTVGYDEFYAKSNRRSGYLGPSQDLTLIRKQTHAGYLLEEVTFDDRWLVNAGFRETWQDYSFDQRTQISGKSQRKSSLPSYEGGLGYKYNPVSKVYVLYARSFRLPAVDEFYQNYYDFGSGVNGGLNTNLTYQRSDSVHWGVKDNTIKNVNLNADAYWMDTTNEIFYDPNLGFGSNTNYSGITRRLGMNYDAQVSMFNDVLIPSAGLGWQRALFFNGRYGTNRVPMVPDYIFNAGLRLKPTDFLSTGIVMNYVGSQFVLSDQNNRYPKLKGYEVFDWDVRFMEKNFECWLGLRNIFDKHYYPYASIGYNPDTSANDVGYYPAPTRNVTAGVKVKF